MAKMALFNRSQSGSLAGYLLLVLLLRPVTVLANADIDFYETASCEDTSSHATVSTISHDGACGQPNATIRSLAATVSGASRRFGCTGQLPPLVSPPIDIFLLGDGFTARLRSLFVEAQPKIIGVQAISFDANMNLVSVYSDPDCSYDAQAASLDGTCTTFPFTPRSFSVDCTSVNSTMGDIEGSVGDGTDESSSDSETSTSSTGRTLQVTSATSVGSTISTTPLLASNSATSSSPQKSSQSTSTFLTFTTKAGTSSPIPTTTNSMLVSTASPLATSTTPSSQAPLSNPTNTSTNSNNSNTNLSRNGEIVVGVVIPSVSVIVAILIFIDQRRRHKNGGWTVFNLYYYMVG